MSTINLGLMSSLIVGALCAGLMPPSAAHAAAEFKLTSPASPQGSVEIVDLSGSVDIEGWNRPEVEVTGTPKELAGRVRLTRTGDQVAIHVMPFSLHDHDEDADSRENSDLHEDSDAELRLVIHVPAGSSVATSLVSANLSVKDLEGDTNLQTISGTVKGEVNGNLRVNTVTGAVHISARTAQRIEIRTISGSVDLTGGSGEAEVSTVSGKVRADLGTLTRGRFKSMSGDVMANYAVAQNARIEGESMSGNIRFGFSSMPDADFDVRSFSGTIDNCFGPKPAQAQYGPGSTLMFKGGEGRGSVRVVTKSGDIKLCTGSVHASAD
jgi:hypothetical protein